MSANMIVVNTNEMPWSNRFNEKIGRDLFRKELYQFPEDQEKSRCGL